MDLEFMILDTLDSIRPSQFKKFDDFSQANAACEKIEAFENANAKSETEFVGQPLFNSQRDQRDYDDLIDDLLYEDANDEEESKTEDKEPKKTPSDEAQQVVKIPQKEIQMMREQQQLIKMEIEKKIETEFDLEFNKLLQDESNVARKDPRNLFMMN